MQGITPRELSAELRYPGQSVFLLCIQHFPDLHRQIFF